MPAGVVGSTTLPADNDPRDFDAWGNPGCRSARRRLTSSAEFGRYALDTLVGVVRSSIPLRCSGLSTDYA